MKTASSFSTSALLVELFTEELPPQSLAQLAQAFADGLMTRLANFELLADGASYESYATPRRLAVLISDVNARAATKEVREKVLPVSVALDSEGQPSAPLAKKLAALNLSHLTIADLERASDGKHEAFFVTRTLPGAKLADALQTALDETLAQLPIAKTMSYQLSDGTSVQFVRPAHGLMALHGADIVPVTALGLAAGRTTWGHRFLSSGEITLSEAQHYADTLRDKGRVLASYTARREAIRNQLLARAGNDNVLMPDALLDEVTALVEWPTVYVCHFDEVYLSVPQECLILTMQTNQKYFALTDANHQLQARFLVVSNIESATPKEIIEGNERVVRPRLADAKFFFEQDKKQPLAERVPLLADVIYHQKLGSQLQRIERIQAIAAQIAPLLGVDPALAARAAYLAKADLTTAMVGEFPELQGVMGMYYARHDGEDELVARTCSEHYQPRFAGDALPSTPVSTVVALADKVETLVGIWGIGLVPTGEKDPFALRRHALGVLRILLEKVLPLELTTLLQIGYAPFAGLPTVKDPLPALLNFCTDRLRGLLRERGYQIDEIDAVLQDAPTRLDDLIARLDAVRAFTTLPEASALAAANKRITNILKKSSATHLNVQPQLFTENAEHELHAQLEKITPNVQAHLSASRYTEALSTLAQLRLSVDTFFEQVMVNSEDQALRNNRLALLAQLHTQMNGIADLSKLAA